MQKVIEKPTVLRPPDVLLESCEAPPQQKLRTVGNLVESHQAYRMAFCNCAAKIEALRAIHYGESMKDACR